MEYKFVQKWDENVEIDWWKRSRKRLNRVIEAYNDWQIYDQFDSKKGKTVLAIIRYCKETMSIIDGGSEYLKVLIEMENFINECIEINSYSNKENYAL